MTTSTTTTITTTTATITTNSTAVTTIPTLHDTSLDRLTFYVPFEIYTQIMKEMAKSVLDHVKKEIWKNMKVETIYDFNDVDEGVEGLDDLKVKRLEIRWNNHHKKSPYDKTRSIFCNAIRSKGILSSLLVSKNWYDYIVATDIWKWFFTKGRWIYFIPFITQLRMGKTSKSIYPTEYKGILGCKTREIWPSFDVGKLYLDYPPKEVTTPTNINRWYYYNLSYIYVGLLTLLDVVLLTGIVHEINHKFL